MFNQFRIFENNLKSKLILFIKPRLNKKIITFLNKFYLSNIERMAIGDCISISNSRTKVDFFISRQITVSFTLFLFLLFFLKNIWIALLLSVLYIFLFTFITIKKLDNKMKCLEYSFPEAIQIFYDNYLVSKNIKNSLIHVSEKTDGSIKILFENVLRKIYSGKNYILAIDEMASTLNIFYAYAFAEILKLSLSDAGDVSNEIAELLELIQEDIEDKEKTKSELHENKMLFYLLNVITAVIFVFNILFHPYGKELYAYTIKGSIIITIWVLQIIGGLIFIDINEKI